MSRYSEEALSHASFLRTKSQPDGMVRFHTDANLVHWYRWQERGEIPVQRIGKMKEYLGWISAGISGSELERLTDIAIKSIQEAAISHKTEAASKKFALAQAAILEIQNNHDRISPAQLLIDYIACQYVIEGENPRIWDQENHSYKVDAILMDERNGAGFFLRQREWLRLTELLKITETTYQQLEKQSENSRSQVEAILKYLETQR